MRVSDRHDSEFALGPTHEEVLFHFVRVMNFESYKTVVNIIPDSNEIPGDELRPRFVTDEFIMKDGISPCDDKDSLDKTYRDMCEPIQPYSTRLDL